MSRSPLTRLRTRRPPRPEEVVERKVRGTFELAGGTVCKFSQGVRGHVDRETGKWINDRGGTRQTPGITDLEVWFPRIETLAKFEVKTPDGMRLHDRMLAIPMAQVKKSQRDDWRRAQAQHAYEQLCRQCKVPYGRGGVPEAVLLLTQLGLVKE